MAKKTGLTAVVREILADAEDSLTIRQVLDGLHHRGESATRDQVKSVFFNAEQAGEFIRCEIGGHIHYTMNPEFEPKRPNARKRPEGSFTEAILQALQANAGYMTAGEIVTAMRKTLGTNTPNSNSVLAILSNLAGQGRVLKSAAPGQRRFAHPDFVSPSDAGTGDDVPPASVASAADPLPQAGQVPASESSSVPIGGTLSLGSLADLHLLDEASSAEAAPKRIPYHLRDRIGAIVQDIEDALEDACKAELPHALIRHLVSANNAANRAAREIGG